MLVNGTCAECAYWQRLEGDYSELGLCRARPPATRCEPDCVASRERAVWPMTGQEDWCGEFQRRVDVPRLRESADQTPPVST